jgi:hypothetical protein
VTQRPAERIEYEAERDRRGHIGPDPYVWHSVADLIDGAPEGPVQSLEEMGLRVRAPWDYSSKYGGGLAQGKMDAIAPQNSMAQDMSYVATTLWGEKPKVDPYAQPGVGVLFVPPKGPSPWRHVIFALIVLMGVLGIVLMAAPR